MGAFALASSPTVASVSVTPASHAERSAGTQASNINEKESFFHWLLRCWWNWRHDLAEDADGFIAGTGDPGSRPPAM